MKKQMTEQSKLITEWLSRPHMLDAREQQTLNELLGRYPYLAPAQLMQNAGAFANDGFSGKTLEEGHLFMGNWLHYYQMMEDSLKAKPAAENTPDATSTENDTIAEESSKPLAGDTVLQPEESTAAAPALDTLIQPLYVENYFQHQGIDVPDELPADMDQVQQQADEKSLLVMMGFDEWLLFLKKKSDDKKSEEEDKAALRSIWQREKLAAAIGEEDDNIPEAVFEMAINSIDKQDIMVSESLAEIHVKQGKYEKAIEIYRKLSLQNPEKKTYFAAKINHLNKEKLS